MNGLTKLLLVAGIAASIWYVRREPAGPERGSVTSELVTDLTPGEEFEVASVCRPGQWTVIEFGAPW